jgi:hypothetical protein
VSPDDVRTQEEVDQQIVVALLDQARREYAGAKALVHMMREHAPDYADMAYFEQKVAQTRAVVETFSRLLKTGLPDPTRENGGQAPDA